MTHEQLAEKLRSLFLEGTEQEVRSFIIEHFAEFPLETQKEFAGSLVTEALESKLDALESVAALAARTAGAVDTLARERASDETENRA